MRDEDYRSEQLPTYGAVGQPAAVARMGRHLRTVRIGQVCAVAATATAVLAFVFYGDGWEGVGRGWFIALMLFAATLSALCLLQLIFWMQAAGAWSGQRRVDTRRLRSISWAVHVIAYAVTGAAVVVGVVAIVEASWYATASIMVMLTLLLMGVALVAAGVQYVHRSGPPGAAPAHMRKVVARQNSGKPDRPRS